MLPRADSLTTAAMMDSIPARQREIRKLDFLVALLALILVSGVICGLIDSLFA